MLLGVQTSLSKQGIFLIVPFYTVDLLSLVGGEFGVEFRSEEVNHREFVLGIGVRRWYDTVQRRGQDTT